MKMSLHTSCYTHFFIKDMLELIDYFADLGYDALDLEIVRSYPGTEDHLLLDENEWLPLAKRLKAKMEERHMFYGQAHAPIIAYAETVTEEDKRQLRQCIKVCGYFGIKNLTVHLLHVKDCTRESYLKVNYDFFKEFFPLLDEYDVDFCIENYGYWNEPDCYSFSADDLLAFIDYAKNPHIHATWDTGHGNLTRQPQYESVVKLGDHLRCVHIQDNHYPIKQPDGCFSPDAHTIPLFGNVNFDGFIQGLIDIGYKGTFNFESDVPNRKGHIDFVYNGKSQLKLKPIPFKVREMADQIQAYIGEYMLKTYGLWEKE